MRYFITGGTSGFGMSLVAAVLDRGHEAVTTFRSTEGNRLLRELVTRHASRLETLYMDLLLPDGLAELDKWRSSNAIDILINNAGVSLSSTALSPDIPNIDQCFAVNALGPVRVSSLLIESLLAGGGKSIINISSDMASLTQANGIGSLAYRMSKAALNMVTRQLAAELAAHKIIAVSIHPGWMRTKMGGEHAPLDPKESAEDLLDFISHLRMEHSGGFFDRRGQMLTW